MDRRSLARLAVTMSALVVLAIAGFRALVVEPPAAPPEPLAPPAIPAQVRAVTAVAISVVGQVERSGEGGAWVPMTSGDRLQEDQVVRTGADSTAELQVGDAARLTASSETELTVGRLDEKVHVFRLSRGRVAAVVDPSNGRTLRIESDAGVVEAASARFAVMKSGQVLAVATETGGVTLTAAGQTIGVPAGELALSDGVSPPRGPRPLPRELVLKVVRAKLLGESCAVIDGVAEPGAEVRVGGRPVEVGISGQFRVEVPREPGRTDVLISTRDVSGRAAEQRIACGAPTASDQALLPPVSRVRVDWKTPGP